MKANELMIGDWVMLNDSHYQVEEISQKGWLHLTDNGHRVSMTTDYILDVLEGVTLTDEILEANGFEQGEYSTDDEWVFEIGNGCMVDAEVRVSPDEEGERTWVAGIVGHNGTTLQLLFDYVHELQHAMRVCGIDKEIKVL